jgi:hypothetical protein
VPLADDTLQRLFARGERARLSGSQRVVRESFKDLASVYWKLGVDGRGSLHAALERAATAGAVTLAWARQGGDDRPLEFVVLRDLDRLAAFLRVSTASNAVQEAADTLARWSENPRVADLLDAWRHLKKVRTLGPESAGDFADALHLVDAMATTTEDRLARPLSTELFGRSKRIEELYTHLDLLTADSLSAPARHWSEVLGALGIRKEPQPFLIAGGGHLELTRGPDVAIALPFVGIANHALTSYRGSPSWLLSVENLTTFHQCAELLAGAECGVVLFSGGMPSPSWATAYTHVLLGLPETARVYHWGDHDEGGFRIAARISAICAQAGRTLLPWYMEVAEGNAASEAQRRTMAANARRAGWEDLAREMLPVLLEQEFQLPNLPPS